MEKFRKFGRMMVFVAAAAMLAGVFAWLAGCGDAQAGGASRSDLILASTTDIQDSGLNDVLLPAFEQAYPAYTVKINAVGTGEALKLGEQCDADAVLVHAPESEKKFVADGFGTVRSEVMYNDFVVVGPNADPAGISGSKDAAAAFKKIADSQSLFISRGDNSGTNTMELKLWTHSGIGSPAGEWYKNIGQGMGEALTVTNETVAYTLADRSTWLSMKDKLPNLVIEVEGDKALFNQYSIIPVNPGRCPQENAQGATDFAAWLVSPGGQNVIGDYGREKYGQQLYVPDAK